RQQLQGQVVLRRVPRQLAQREVGLRVSDDEGMELSIEPDRVRGPLLVASELRQHAVDPRLGAAQLRRPLQKLAVAEQEPQLGAKLRVFRTQLEQRLQRAD